MNRQEFMQQLNRLLADVPESDRQDAIAYYQDYFDEAGPEHEAEVIQELGSPGKVAATIKAEIFQSANNGEFTENGYRDSRFGERTQVPASRGAQGENRERRQKRGAGKWALIIVLLIFASPFLAGLGSGVLGVGAGILAVFASVYIALAAGGAGMIIGGIAAVVTGIARCLVSPANGLLTIGAGMVLLAVGLLLIMAFIALVFKVTPKVFRAAANWFSRILHRGKGGEAREKVV